MSADNEPKRETTVGSTSTVSESTELNTSPRDKSMESEASSDESNSARLSVSESAETGTNPHDSSMDSASESEGEPLSSDRDTESNEQKLRVALRAIDRMSNNLARTKHSSVKTEELMRQLGVLRRTNAILVQVLVVFVLWLALATGAVASFVTPESFEAWREGIAIQLIRRTPQTSIFSLQLRRIFGYLCERSFFEVPNTLFVALRYPIQLLLGTVLAVPFAAALRAGAVLPLRRCDDLLLSGSILLVANTLFLGDDFSLPIAPLMAKVGGFLLMTSVAVLALPTLIRSIHRPRPWSAYKTQILRQLRAGDTQVPTANEPAAARVAPVMRAGLLRRVWSSFISAQMQRRKTATSKQVAMVLVANAAVYALDTLISHD